MMARTGEPDLPPGTGGEREPARPHMQPHVLHEHLEHPTPGTAEVVAAEIVHDRVLTVPNAITVGRLLFLPLYLWLLFAHDDRLGAAILLGILGATDFCDGYVARHFNQVSSLGKLLDPTADRVLFFVGIGGIIAARGAPLWFSIVVLGREVVVAGITVVITLMGAKPVDVTWFGKAGTFGLMCAFPLFLAGSSEATVAPFCTALAWIAGVPGVLLSFYAALLYVPRWRAALEDARAERAAARG